MSEDLKSLGEIAKIFQGKKGCLQYPGRFEAAVFIPLVETAEGLSILFEERSPELAWQPGEISLPGGRIEKDDLSPADAAIRETCEELGLSPVDLEFYGEMDFFVSHMGLVIYPSVGRILAPERMKPQPSEVARTFTVPLRWFLETEPRRGSVAVATKPQEGFPFDLLPKTYKKDWRSRTQYEVLFYPYQEWVIWGLTGQIISSFLKTLRESE